MKPTQLYRFNFPILRWLLVLFLATGISDFRDIHRQSFKIETVDSSSIIFHSETGVARYSAAPQRPFSLKNRVTFFKIINLLSLNLNNKIQVVLKRQTVNIYSFPRYISYCLLSPNLHSNPSEDPSDFIS